MTYISQYLKDNYLCRDFSIIHIFDFLANLKITVNIKFGKFIFLLKRKITIFIIRMFLNLRIRGRSIKR